MKTYTVQCRYARYMQNIVDVEAETTEEACQKAIAAAESGGGWSEIKIRQQTFIFEMIEEEPVLEPPFLPVPARFTEHGADYDMAHELLSELRSLVTYMSEMPHSQPVARMLADCRALIAGASATKKGRTTEADAPPNPAEADCPTTGEGEDTTG